MKGKSLFLMILAICCMSATVSAQITTGAPSAKTIKTGNRATAGDYGLYLGVTSDLFKSLAEPTMTMTAMPLINFKYMKTDKTEYRLGLEIWRKTTKLSGDLILADESTIEVLDRTLESRYYFYPGLAYHFSNTNLLDVYVGAELPIGFTHDKLKNVEDDITSTQSRLTFDMGLGAFIGLQAYVGNLPLAVGFEYGVSSLFRFGDKVKCKMEDGKDSQEFYIEDFDATANEYENLHVNQGEIGQQFRFTLTYYFKKGNNTKTNENE